MFAYVDGKFVAEEEAQISVFDRGFLFADGVYEVSAVLDGRLVDNDAHLQRLERSLKEIAIKFPVSVASLTAIQNELIARNSLEHGTIYLQVTRGSGPRNFNFPANSPSVVMFTQKRDIVNLPEARTGIHVASVPDLRWKRRDIKSIGLLAQVLAKQAAAEAGCQEALLVEDGIITEGASSSFFIVTAADGW
jgi:D-alanine transaminase